jgi:xanthine dehydrogenase accessory factor
MTDWLDLLASFGGYGEPAVLATVAKTEGSAPREAGAKMIVTRGRALGTIGGGHLELEATRRARALLDVPDAAVSLERFTLGPEEDQACGGAARVLFERFAPPYPRWIDALRARRDAGDIVVRLVTVAGAPAVRLVTRRDAGCEPGPVTEGGLPGSIRSAARGLFACTEGPDALLVGKGSDATLLERVRPADFNVMLFGAGHVGAALVRVLGTLPCRVTWIDERAAQFPGELPANVRAVRTDDPAAATGSAAAGAFFLVMTHSHGLDLDICAAILARGDFRYVGLIGSDTKRRTFERRLAERGFDAATIRRLRCPIGIEGLKSKDPSIIAVAVAAELLQVREAPVTAAAVSGEAA